MKFSAEEIREVNNMFEHDWENYYNGGERAVARDIKKLWNKVIKMMSSMKEEK